MDEYVWLSRMQSAADKILLMSTDISECRRDDAILGLKDLKAGMPVAQNLCPKVVWADPANGERPEIRQLPPLFNANGYWFVSDSVAKILGRFDLGEGKLYPVRAFESDRKTIFPGEWWCWTFGNRKLAFSKTESRNLQPFGPPNIESDWASMPSLPQDFDVAVSSLALEGPEIWIDPPLFKSVFLSTQLGDALVEAGFQQIFELSKARVV